MPNYEVTIRFPEEDGVQTARGAAEGVFNRLLLEMFHGSVKMEVKNKKTGKVESIELESDLENDTSMLRFMALMMVADKFLSEEQEAELLDWVAKNVDGHSIAWYHWPGWEPIIGKLPKQFRTPVGV
jgi:hypothetical protein